jgi:hydrogenase/urease accessory protein HupE
MRAALVPFSLPTATFRADVQRISFALLLLATAAVPAAAHPLAPSLLEVSEGAGRLDVLWRTPTQRAPGTDLAPLLPGSCRVAESLPVRIDGTAFEARWALDCGGAPLVGMRIGAKGIGESGADVLLRVSLADGRSFHSILTAEEPAFVVPQRQSRANVAESYVVLGIEHILGGWDHLLFVLGLVLLVGRGGGLLSTITAFTVGHSITLSLAVLGYVPLAPPVAEVAIAASILLLAAELGRDRAAPESLLRRRPWVMASAFGLLHGLGFAGALTEAGLPAGEVPLALASFNAGIEIGQLAFVAMLLMLARASRGIPRIRLRLVPAYAIGSMAAFWLLDRTPALLELL